MDDLISRQAAKLKVARVIWEDGESCYDFNDKCVDCLDDVQPEEAIYVSWIEAKITQLLSMDNEFAGLTVHIIKTMLNEWRKEARGEREHNK